MAHSLSQNPGPRSKNCGPADILDRISKDAVIRRLREVFGARVTRVVDLKNGTVLTKGQRNRVTDKKQK